MKLIVKHYEGMSATAAGGILLHYQVTWYTHTHTLYTSDPPPLPFILSLTNAVYSEGGKKKREEGEQLREREREREHSKARGGGKAVRRCEPRLQPTTLLKQGTQERGGQK